MKAAKKLFVGWLIFATILSGALIQFADGQVIGYTSAFQGPRIWFDSAQWNGVQYTFTPTTTLSFNPDGANNGKPAIYGEMTTVFHPEESSLFAGWPAWNPVPASYTQNLGLYANGWNGSTPSAIYNWTIGDQIYSMAKFDMKWYVSFSSAPTPFGGGEDPFHQIDPLLGPTHVENVYNNLKMWFRLDTTPTWYIEGGGVGYIAIAKVQLGDVVAFKGRDVSGNIVQPRTGVQVVPSSQAGALMIYYNRWGAEPVGTITPETYMGKTLNPAYFRNTTYLCIELADFGVSSDAVNFLTTATKGDVATFCFQISVFVIGDYQVQDIQKDPSHFGRFTPVESPGGGFLGWLLSSATLSWLIPVIIFFLILIFAPWLLVAIISIFRGR